MYTPNTREELKAMQNIMPISAFGAFRTAKKAERVKTSAAHKLSISEHDVAWLEELRSRSVLPVESTFLVRLYRCT